MEQYMYGDENSSRYTYGDVTRAQSAVITQVTEQNNVKICCEFVNNIKQSFNDWKKQYSGLSVKEAVFRFIYNLSHTGVSIATMVYCAALCFIIGGFVSSKFAYADNYKAFYHSNSQLLILLLNIVVGIVSILFRILPFVFIFDLVLFTIGFQLVINSAWRIQNGYSDPNYSSFIVFGLMILSFFPFRIFWWFKFHPNKYVALEMYAKLSSDGLLHDLNKSEIQTAIQSAKKSIKSQTKSVRSELLQTGI